MAINIFQKQKPKTRQVYRVNPLPRKVLITSDEVIKMGPVSNDPGVQKLDDAIIIAEERFMKKLMCKSFYYEFRDAKNKIVTADNKAALEAQVNVGNSGEPIVLEVGEMINAIEFVQDDNWKEWWFEFGWKILAECVVYVASPVNWIRYEAQGMMQNNPKSVAITNDGQGAASAELKDVRWMMDKMLMDRIDPLIEASHEWLCDHKGSFPGYNCKRCHCDDDGNGVSWQRKSPWVHGVYDKKKKGHCCD